MKTFVCATLSVLFLAFVLIGCGGAPAATTTTKPNVPALNAADVFTNRSETWVFRNVYGDTTTVEVIPVDADHSIWHYTKTETRAYWGISIREAELWFDLERDATGAWYSTGGVISAPFGSPWCQDPVTCGYRNERYPVFTKPGQARPYLILPAKADFAYTTLFDDITPIGPGVFNTAVNTVWKTSSYMEQVDTPVFSGMAYVSDQWEGPCTHEKWYFAPGKGMVKILPLDPGDCKGEDPLVTTVRVN